MANKITVMLTLTAPILKRYLPIKKAIKGSTSNFKTEAGISSFKFFLIWENLKEAPIVKSARGTARPARIFKRFIIGTGIIILKYENRIPSIEAIKIGSFIK